MPKFSGYLKLRHYQRRAYSAVQASIHGKAVILSAVFRSATRGRKQAKDLCIPRFASLPPCVALHPILRMQVKEPEHRLGAVIATECMGPTSEALRAAKGSASSDESRVKVGSR